MSSNWFAFLVLLCLVAGFGAGYVLGHDSGVRKWIDSETKKPMWWRSRR